MDLYEWVLNQFFFYRQVIELSSEVERVKQDQQQLYHELGFVEGQQRELEELITPLEKELENIPSSDPDRQHM